MSQMNLSLNKETKEQNASSRTSARSSYENEYLNNSFLEFSKKHGSNFESNLDIFNQQIFSKSNITLEEKIGPNVNIKSPKKNYFSIEEREHFNKKIKIKQKTEVKNNFLKKSYVKTGFCIIIVILKKCVHLHMVRKSLD